MHLAYLDDSGSDRPSPVVVFGGVIIRPHDFWRMDVRIGGIPELILPPEQLEQFEEFHAAELFGGYGVFKDVSEEQRHQAIRQLLGNLDKFDVPFVYAAIDKAALEASAFGSSIPLDVAFRICACGIQDWVTRDVVSRVTAPRDAEEFGTAVGKALIENPFLMIADDSDEKAVKQALRKSFKALRPPSHRKESENARLAYCLDDIYFGDSRSSVGIQLADVCAHVMLRRFRDGIQDEFFGIVAPHAICARAEPYWSQCSHVMRAHDGDTTAVLPGLGTLYDLAMATGPFPPTAPAEGQP